MLKGIHSFLKKFYRSRGFTIIELLFVVAIIGVLFALSLSTYQKRADGAKVQKAAAQMEQILQAAVIYHADHNCWPAGNFTEENHPPTDCPPNPEPGPSNPLAPYLPSGSTPSPWAIKTDANVNFDYSYGPINYDETIKKYNLYKVSLTLPSSLSYLTKRIAALLPIATVDNDNTVTAQTGPSPLPGNPIPPESMITVLDIGTAYFDGSTCKTDKNVCVQTVNKTITKVCPSNTTMTIVTNFIRIDMSSPQAPNSQNMLSVEEIETALYNDHKSVDIILRKKLLSTFTLGKGGSWGQDHVYYLIYCIPN
jgi:prepilin-type N-terminal cleavage/methylation domain-containing protein